MDFIKYDEKTGQASAIAPKMSPQQQTKCQFVKKALNGESETKEIMLTFAAPESVCKIDPKITSHSMKSGDALEYQVGITSTTSTTSTSNCEAVIYEHGGWSGWKKTFKAGEYDSTNELMKSAFRASSIKVPQDCRAKLCTGE